MRGWIEPYTTAAGEKRYTARWRDAAGRKRSKSFKLKRDADTHLADETRAVDLTDPTLTPQFLGRQWLDAYAEDLEHRVRLGNVSPSTHAAYRSVLKKHLRPWLDGKRVDLMQPAEVSRWSKDLSGRIRDGTLAAKTYNNILGCFSAACAFAVTQKWMRVSLADGIRRARVLKRVQHVLDANDRRRLLAAVDDARLQLALRVALFAGLRRGELVGLQWGDLIAGDVPRLFIQRVVVVDGSIRPPKTATSRRTVDVPEALVAHWTAARGASAAGAWVLPSATDAAVPMHPDVFQAAVAPAFVRAGLPTSLHACRHTYASILIDQGETAKYVSTQLGHASIQITLDLYGHLFADSRRAAMDRLDAAAR
jgi:integrase